MMGEGPSSVISLLPWDISVRRARSRRAAHEIVDRKDADRAIRALSEVETYYLIKELGLEGAMPILAVLEPRQITAVIDLDIWHDDRADLDDLLLWLSAFREVDSERVHRAVRSLDPELFALLLRRRLFIWLRSGEQQEEGVPDWLAQPPEELLPLVETPDRRFVLAARLFDELAEDRSTPIDEEDRKSILELVEVLYKDPDFELIAGALRLATSDLSSALEEDASRFRSARLEDHGFPELHRALEIYSPVDPDEVLGKRERSFSSPEMLLPAFHIARLSSGLFQEILLSIESPEVIRRIEGELLPLANAALVADRVEPGDLERVRKVLDRMRAYLEVALSYRVDPSDAIRVGRDRLLAHSARALFRAGYAITLDLAHRARAIRSCGAFRAGGEDLNLLSEVDRAVVEALLERRPAYACVLDSASRAPDDTRPFASSADVEKVMSRLDDLEALVQVVVEMRLGVVNESLVGALDPPLPHERNVDMLLTTGAASVLLGRGFVLEPLGGRELDALRAMLERVSADPKERCFPPSAMDEAIRLARAAAGSSGHHGVLARRIREGLDALAEALSPLVGAGEIDARFVGVVVRRVD